MSETEHYDPRIQTLLDHNDDHWGDPIKNRENLIPYGVLPIDKALYGLDPFGELIVVQGPEKNRKTTFVANVIMNIMEGDKPKDKPVINIDSLESGMRPSKYKDVLVSMMATRFLIREKGHVPHGVCPVCNSPECVELKITPKFLRYMERTPAQMEALNWAIDRMYLWKVLVHGAKIKEGNTRNLQEAYLGDKKSKARWLRMYEEFGMQILVVDHGQQYAFRDEPTDYEKQIRAVSAVGDFVSQYGVAAFFVSQVSLTSLRAQRSSGKGVLTAAGGAKAAQEANTVFTTTYDSGGGLMKIKIEEAREAPQFSTWQPLEDRSGCFYGEATTEPML